MSGTYVVYLVWGPLGAGPVERFAASYRAHPARHEHRLVLLLNGIDTPDLRSRCETVAAELRAEILELPARVLDLDAYRAAAERVEGEAFLFLNTHSEILADGWLGFLAAALMRDGVGLVGATGSLESALSAAPRPLKPFLRSRWPKFPNPHLRTNAFMLRRSLMLSLDWPQSATKRQALALESGSHSITRQVWDRGMEVVVVDRDGRSYRSEQWVQSRTFRSGNQEKLLVADNRTRQYATASARRRDELCRYAWGISEAATNAPTPATFGQSARFSR
ncbi:MAG TPA: hypothetical protein VKR21_09325 [Solirubrobacteraceae bacterium]|nr:hypothetical protein [Solirubrobacteraceae bacterium]